MRRIVVIALFAAACGPRTQPRSEMAGRDIDDAYADARARLVASWAEHGLVGDARVLAAMRAVPRHRFVPADLVDLAYEDAPLPIGYGVTISQPYVVALMTQLADVEPGERVLEVGTGSGYQAAVLAELGARVYSIERIEPLAGEAAALLAELGYDRVEVRFGDGYAGWPEQAPFDAIVVTAAPPTIPTALTEQLALGGKLVAPVGAEDGVQQLVVVERTPTGLRKRRITDVAFVPMVPGLREGPNADGDESR